MSSMPERQVELLDGKKQKRIDSITIDRTKNNIPDLLATAVNESEVISESLNSSNKLPNQAMKSQM